MIETLKAIATECDICTDKVIRVRAQIDHSGVMIIAERRDDRNCAAHLVSWEQLIYGATELAKCGVRLAAAKARES